MNEPNEENPSYNNIFLFFFNLNKLFQFKLLSLIMVLSIHLKSILPLLLKSIGSIFGTMLSIVV